MVLPHPLARFPNLANSRVKVIIGFTINPTIVIAVRKINDVNNGDIAIDNGSSTISIGTRENGAAIAIKSPRAMMKVENEQEASVAVSAFNTHNSFIIVKPENMFTL